ncbi:N(4)-(beta-N-acetylglucosaminyl)-L-asparaginase [Neolewinella lacunae]|uniref:N(4)-(Beta-N-acetylglucosaminyl)-L-asparaginase n=1 Tax=Neolewinella lacunae TaxID=1517758 RepID=A0A923PKM6_9BACT|nr:N(4)-(beta-N-acetylglucosaminyl)-L-asparaginase [Neolewinella lacunae]MBC6993436.1 N(4)-(beta-N-acetylglucosaminyl)-L-asparaginase [Neolewinella lacunae]MDN3636288.1 N(4)-(beta-N-acetylglucosaminyl)-L-asparaginase [Neolewinella lacunae]
MRPTRRSFLRRLPAALAAGPLLSACATEEVVQEVATPPIRPVVIATWQHGQAANARAWEILSAGGSALDAAEAGVMVTEADPEVHTVGRGSFPDRDGTITLDACIMNAEGNCGSVAALQDILHPVSVARMVMEKTPHVMLVGQGAKDFALAQGMEETDLMTDFSRDEWAKWKQGNPDYRPRINIENHDTIGLLTLDSNGDLAGACTTSGAAFKYHGRVGDSPIIGAGLYVDNEIGGATATGWGEAVIRACGCFLVVEFMRQGHSPTEACRLAVERVISKNPDWKDIQVGFIALNKRGETGGYCIQSGFDYAVQSPALANEMFAPDFKIEAPQG